MQQGWKVAAGMFVVCGSFFGLKMAGAQNTAAPAKAKVVAKETVAKEADTKTATDKEAAPAKKAPKKAAGRLPVHYSDIVTEDQKTEIYSIQAGYDVKIDALAAQIKQLQAQQNAEIEALLNAEQKEKLKLAKDAAAAKKKMKAEAAAEAKAAVKAEAEAPKNAAAE